MFENNWGGFGAGAVRGAEAITGSTFIGNISEEGGAVWIGDGTIENCTFIDNSAGFAAGAISTNGSPTILNSTFINNSGPRVVTDPEGVGAIFVAGMGNPHIGGSEFCGNEPGHILGQWTNLGGNTFGPYCPVGDLNGNGNGSVGIADLLILLGEWGECPDPDDCPADLTGNGVVGLNDLLVLLSNWS